MDRAAPESPVAEPVGWIGTGTLGAAAAGRLADQGVRLVLYNRTRATAARLDLRGASLAGSPADVGAICRVVFLCVRGQSAAESLLFDESGLCRARGATRCVIDLGTVSPDDAISTHARLAGMGVDYLEAPVSGGPQAARRGALMMLIAGDAAVAARHDALLRALTASLWHVGEPGTAQSIKLVNNLAEAINLLGAAEALELGLRHGLDQDMLVEILPHLRGWSTYMGVLMERLLAPGAYTSASLAVRLKDLDLALELAERHGLSPSLGACAAQRFRHWAERVGAGADQTSCGELWTSSSASSPVPGGGHEQLA